MIDKIASDLEAKGFIREASELDTISNAIDKLAATDLWQEAIDRWLEDTHRPRNNGELTVGKLLENFVKAAEYFLNKNKGFKACEDIKPEIRGIFTKVSKTPYSSDVKDIFEDILKNIEVEVEEKYYFVIDGGKKGVEYGWMSPEEFTRRDTEDRNRDYMIKETKKDMVKKSIDLPDFVKKELLTGLTKFQKGLKFIESEKNKKDSPVVNNGKPSRDDDFDTLDF